MKDEFGADMAEKNVKVGRVLLPLIAALAVVMVGFLAGLRAPGNFEIWDWLYLWCYVGLLAICIVYTIVIWAFHKRAKNYRVGIRVLTLVFVVILMAWGVCVSLLDAATKDYSNPMVLMMVYLAVSGAILLHPGEMAALFGISFGGYFALEYAAMRSPFDPTVFLNLLTFTAIGVLVSFVRFDAAVKDFMTDIDVIRKNGELSEANDKLKELNDRLEKISITDRLTGLRNRWAFGDRLKEVYERCFRSGKTMSVVMLDIDDFKLINDRHGHAVGDECLIGIAKVLRETVPSSDLFRYGGEEFVVIFENERRDKVHTATEKLRKNIEKRAFTDQKLQMTVSGGQFSEVPVSGLSADNFVINADRALYAAKAAGKNRVEIYKQGDESMLPKGLSI